MLKIRTPLHDAVATFLTCVSRIRDVDLQTRLNNLTDLIMMASLEYQSNGEKGLLYLTNQIDFDKLDIDKKDLVNLYKSRMAKKGAPARYVYDEIMSLAPHGRCPLCAKRYVSTLDHYLAKTVYPILSVVPLNLVPSCAECNKSKLATTFTSAVEQTLHPYFDNIENDRWLYAKVLETAPASIFFYVLPNPEWDDVISQRVSFHFRAFGLAKLYASEAADEIVNIRHQLQRIYDSGSSASVTEELFERAKSCRLAQLNGWRTATYEAFASSAWFCDGGFAFVS